MSMVQLPMLGHVGVTSVDSCGIDAAQIATVLRMAREEMVECDERVSALVCAAADLSDLLAWKLEQLAEILDKKPEEQK